MSWNDTRPPALAVDIGRVVADGLVPAAGPVEFVDGADGHLPTLLEAFEGRVHLISRAGSTVERRTRDWLREVQLLERLGLDSGHLHFVREHRDKHDVARRLGVTHMVDDRRGVLRHLSTVDHRYLFRADDLAPTLPGDPMRGVVAAPDWAAAADLVIASVQRHPPTDLPCDLDVRVMSLGEAENWAASWMPAAVLSVVNRPRDAARCAVEQRIVCFRDVAVGEDLMLPGQVQEILQFVRLLSDGDRLLIHCRGGIGRSPAVGMGVLAATGVDAAAAALRVRDVRPQATPNPHVLRQFDRALGLGDALTTAALATFPGWKPGRPR